jgi:hypothetical protein
VAPCRVCGVQASVIRALGLAALLVLSLPSAFRADVPQSHIVPGMSFGPWDDLPIAIAGMRLESPREFTIGSDRWTIHTGTVLAIFKTHPRPPSIGESLPIFEEWGLLGGNDYGKVPPWDTSGPIPAGSQWVLYLAWDQDLGGFRIVRALY